MEKLDKVKSHKGAYHPIEEWVSYISDFSERATTEEDDEPAYNGIEALRDHPDLLAKVKSRLEGFGFHRIAYVRNGDSAIVFKTVDAQLVRISVDGHEPPRLYHPAILQPIYAEIMPGKFTNIRFEIMPAVRELRNGHNGHLDELKRKLLPILEMALKRSNLNPTDLKAINVGVLLDGTPIVVDGGAVEAIYDKSILTEGEHLDPWFATDKEGNPIWKQRHYFPRIGSGKITGVITDEDIRDLEEHGHGHLLKCIRDKQLCYYEELGAWIARAENAGGIFKESLAATYNDETDRLIGPKKSWRKQMSSPPDPSNDLAHH